ncbi:hypothetical protein RED65_02013 [Oceanobacter sp. RED65]|uniref:Uncharacterized protein n=1 Tax=Bermanella marisrubri TaxID=207949 RepID=Q1MY21_9GAMM|nr:hypothetical protein RED65_02013 [Oceanobacter sp. RED65] [Bermanella marisrubri]
MQIWISAVTFFVAALFSFAIIPGILVIILVLSSIAVAGLYDPLYFLNSLANREILLESWFLVGVVCTPIMARILPKYLIT